MGEGGEDTSGAAESTGGSDEFAGAYGGTATADCGQASSGIIMFTASEDGTMTGSASKFGLGSVAISGTVDGVGGIDGQASAFGVVCIMEGVIDDVGEAAGTFDCPTLGCMGAWDASLVTDA